MSIYSAATVVFSGSIGGQMAYCTVAQVPPNRVVIGAYVALYALALSLICSYRFGRKSAFKSTEGEQ